MADESDNLGNLSVNITGDFSELQTSLDAAASTAADTATAIAGSLQSIVDASGLAGGDLQVFQSVLQDDQAAGISLSQSLQDLANSAATVGDKIAGAAGDALENLQAQEQAATDSTQGLGDAAGNAIPPINDLGTALGDADDQAGNLESGFSELGNSFLALYEAFAITEGLKDFIEEAVLAYGATQNIATSLQLLGSSAEEAEGTISDLSQMSLSLAVPFTDLVASARSLSVALHGVDDIDLTDVLTAAANSAAITGKSFDTVTAALQRVITTGQVSSRQLIALGVTWQQLATTAGVSIEDIQATLKKGGQSATADLELVIQTINSFASGAAEAQAQNVLGQITTLENEVKLLFESIGEAIAPVLTGIVAGVGEGVSVARQLVAVFQGLPAPIQNVAVVFGLAVAALAPLTLALGTLGLLLNGVTQIAPAFAAIMNGLAGSATVDAAAERSAAAATEAHGAAAVTAAAELQALAGAEAEQAGAAEAGTAGLLGFNRAAISTAEAAEDAAAAAGIGGLSGALLAVAAYALPVATAIAVTVDNLNTLKAKWADVDSEIRSHSIMDAIQSGATLTALQQIGNSVEQVRSAFGGMGVNAATVMQAITSSVQPPIQTLYDMGFTAQQVQTALKGIGTAAVSAWAAFDSGATIDEMKQVGLNVDAITTALNKMGPAAKNNFSMIHAGVVDASSDFDILKSGITLLNSNLVTLGETAQGVVQAQKDLAQKVTDAQTAVAQLGIALKAGGASAADYNAAVVNLTKAQAALAASQGDSTKAVKDQKDSWQALADVEATNATNLKNAQDTYDALTSAYNSGLSSLNGVAVNLKTITDAANNLAAAQLKATGEVPQWTSWQGSVASAVQATANKFTTLENNVQQTSDALYALQKSFSTGVVVPGTNVVATLAMVTDAFNNQQKAIAAQEKATTADGYALEDITGKASNLATVLVNGTAVAVSSSVALQGIGDAANETSGAVTYLAGTVSDGSTKITASTSATKPAAAGIQGIADAANEGSVAVSGLVATVSDGTPKIIANTNATKTATEGKKQSTDASQQLANQINKENQAWQNGQIVVQNYNGQVVIVDTAATSAANSTSNLADQVKQMSSVMQSAGEMTNEEADALLQLASDADAAADAVNNLNSANSKAGKGGGGGGGGGNSGDSAATALYGSLGNDVLGLIQTGSAAFAGGAGAADIAGDSATNMMQNLANATDQVVQSVQGIFFPIQDAAGLLDGSLKYLNGQIVTSTATTTAQTAAVTASTAATVAQTSASADTEAAFEAAVAAAQALADSTGVVVTNMYGTFIPGADAAATATTTLASTATAATVAIAPLATAAATATEGIADLGDATQAAAATTAQSAAAASEATGIAFANLVEEMDAAENKLGKVTGNTTSFGPQSNAIYAGTGPSTPSSGGASEGIVAGGNPMDWTNPNPGSSFGQFPLSGTPSANGIQLTVNVTGNSVTSQALVNQLANQVGSQIVTNLRTIAGLKL